MPTIDSELLDASWDALWEFFQKTIDEYPVMSFPYYIYTLHNIDMAIAENADRPPPRIDGVLTYLGEAEELDFWRHLRRLMRVMIAINPDNIQRMRRAIVEAHNKYKREHEEDGA